MSSIIRFEIVYNIRKSYTYIFFLLLMVQGIWYTIGTNDLYDNNNVMLNAPAINYLNLGIMGLLLFAIVAIISAGSLARDLESGSANIVYPAIVKEKEYFFAKYIGALIVNLVIVTGYPLGILIYPYLGAGTLGQFGPVPFGQLAHGFLLFTVPNLIFLITFSIFLVVIFRRGVAAYLGVLLILIFFLVTVTLRGESGSPFINELMDPFGYCSIANIIDKMDVHELNTAYLPITKNIVLNRLIWGFITMVLFVLSIIKFNFKSFIALKEKKKFYKNPKQNSIKGKTPSIDLVKSNITYRYDIQTCVKKTIYFAWQDMRNLFYSPVFSCTMGAFFLMFIGFNLMWTSQYYLTTSHLPLTSTMTYIRIPMMIVISLFIIILSGELLFKDRTSNVWVYADAGPTPLWVFILSRWLTMGSIAFIIFCLIMAAGIISQLSMGFREIELGLYIRDLFCSRFGWLTLLQIISMTFFFGALFQSRLKGHIFSVGIFLFICGSVDYRLIEQLHFGFPFVPGVFGPEEYNYSQMNGYGVLDSGIGWYTAAWSILGLLFLSLSILLWNRGIDRPIRERFKLIRQKFKTPGGRGLAAFIFFCFISFILCEVGIIYNLKHKGGYLTKAQKAAEAADYEKTYGIYKELPQPKITDLDLKLDLFPELRKADYFARLTLKNQNNTPIDSLHLDWSKKLFISDISSSNVSLIKHQEDKFLRHAIYKLGKPLEPGSEMELSINATLSYKGFNQSDFQGDLTYNGTVLGTDFLPLLGYDNSRELDNNKKRIQQGLTPIKSRMAGLDNPYSRANRFESKQCDNLNWKMLISTSDSQSIIAPGKPVKQWKKNRRNYAIFESDKPGLFNYKIISGHLDLREFYCANVACKLFHDPKHTYNLNLFQDAIKQAVPWLSTQFGPYPHKLLKVVEKPFYKDDFITFANTTAVSETRGWTADIKKPEDGQYIYLSLTTELAKHWLKPMLKVADVEGAQILLESIARYFGLRFMDEIWGDAQTAKWLDKAYADYEKGKGKEAIEEKPLLFVDKALYLSREKGGLALYAIAQRTGLKKFDQWLVSWLKSAAKKEELLTSIDFYKALKSGTPANIQPFIREWFEGLVQYRMAVNNGVLEDGKLILTLSASRRNSKQGMENEVLSYPLEIGFCDENGLILEVKQITLQAGTNRYELSVEKNHKRVILDPNYWYLIENRKRCFKNL